MDKDVGILGAGWLGILLAWIAPLTEIAQFVAVILGIVATIMVIWSKWKEIHAPTDNSSSHKTED